MPDDGPTSERLDSLRTRWESERDSDRASGVFLQLADEYRRLDRTGDAMVVLEEGIRRNPNHPAALVALGRCRLELGRAADATEVLERVIASDPTQMVAYRLLVEAYVERGMAEEARQRLRVYSLLNDADPEIAELRRRIGEVERRHRDESPYLEDDPADGDPDVALPEAPASAAAASAAPAPAGDDGEPFPQLLDPSASRRYLEALASAGIFVVDREEDGEGAAEPEVGATPELAAEPQPATEPDETSDDLFGLGRVSKAPTLDLSTLLDGTHAGAAPPPDVPAADDRGARPTVTLGRLYLRQGHREEAETIFRQVLDRDPDNAEAHAELSGLEGEVAETGPSGLTAADLLADWDGSRDADGTTARKRHVLERYLERIRGRSGRDVH